MLDLTIKFDITTIKDRIPHICSAVFRFFLWIHGVARLTHTIVEARFTLRVVEANEPNPA